MAKKKKGARIKVVLVCKESGATNYVTTYNKMNGDKPGGTDGVMKYCPQLRKHTLHKVVTKMK